VTFLLLPLVLPACDAGHAGSLGIYGECGGGAAYAPGACEDEACAADPLSERVYPVWKDAFLAHNGLTEAEYDARIDQLQMTDSSMDTYWAWTVQFRWQVGWAWIDHWVYVAPEGDIAPGDAGEPTDAEIAAAVEQRVADDVDLSLDSVVSQAAIHAAFEDCATDMIIDWCQIAPAYEPAGVFVQARKTVSEADNQCLEALVDVETGELTQCAETACWYP
jgi:hypothetical protein